MPRLYATIVLPSGFTIEKESYLRLFNPNASFEKGNLVPDQIDAVNANITVSLMGDIQIGPLILLGHRQTSLKFAYKGNHGHVFLTTLLKYGIMK